MGHGKRGNENSSKNDKSPVMPNNKTQPKSGCLITKNPVQKYNGLTRGGKANEAGYA
jgi:hypothetical protein